MSDQTETPYTPTPPTAELEAPVADTVIESPPLGDVAAPDNALVGDANLPDPRPVDVKVYQDDVPAQVTGPANKVVDTVKVHEVFVTVDEVITDPSSPLAVQIPDAGRGFLDLPIHAIGGRKPEDVFAEANAAAEKSE